MMTPREQLTQEIQQISDAVLEEVLDFLLFLKAREEPQNINANLNQSEDQERNLFDPNAKPIWELAAEISAQVPDEEWQKLPTDLARRFDYYQKQRQEQK